MQWLPAEPRAGNSQKDDWAWTLRSAANRPLLRWLEDGPLVVVSDGSGAAPKLKARLMATGQAGTFGESGERFSAAVEDTPSDSRELLARVDFAPGHRCRHGIDARLPPGSGLCRLGAIGGRRRHSSRRWRAPSGEEGLDEAAIRTWETLHLGDEFDAEVGSTEVVGAFCGAISRHRGRGAAQCFGGLAGRQLHGWLPHGHHAAAARCRATRPRPGPGCRSSQLRNGKLVLERGLHQEIGWERKTDASGMTVLVFADNIENPVIEAMGHFAGGDSAVPPLPRFLTGQRPVARRRSRLLQRRELWPASSAVCPAATSSRQLCQRQRAGDAGPAAAGSDGPGAWLQLTPGARRPIPSRSPALWMAPEPAGRPATAGSPKILSPKWLRMRWTPSEPT